MDTANIAYKGKKIAVGIDVHRKFFVVAAVCEGQLLKRCRLPANGVSVVAFLRKHFNEAELKSCYEAGDSGFWLHRHLVSQGIKNIVVHPAAVEIESRNRVKTDKRDALKQAVQLDAGRLRGIHVPSEAEEHQRLLHRTRAQLVGDKTRVKNRVRMKLLQFGLLPAEDDRVMSQAMLREVLAKEMNGELRLSLEALQGVWKNLNSQILILQKALREQAKEDKLEEFFRQVPGFGPLAARVVSTELGDMSQFANVRGLYSFTGLTPCEWSSGQSVHRGHISRQGSRRLRHVLIEAAWRAVKKDSALKEIFERIAARRGKKIAIVAVARKLIGRARAELKARGMYELGYKQAA